MSTSLMMIGSGGGIIPALTTRQVFAQTVGETSQTGNVQQAATTGENTTTTTTPGAANATTTTNATTGGQARIINMMPTEMEEIYRWSINDTINPTITLVANVNNTITVDNPTDAEHELIIAKVDGGEVAATEDLQPGGHGELSIMPNATDSLRYYCEYHPDTMLGDILITNTTSMNNATTNTTTTAAVNATTMTNQTQ